MGGRRQAYSAISVWLWGSPGKALGRNPGWRPAAAHLPPHCPSSCLSHAPHLCCQAGRRQPRARARRRRGGAARYAETAGPVLPPSQCAQHSCRGETGERTLLAGVRAGKAAETVYAERRCWGAASGAQCRAANQCSRCRPYPPRSTCSILACMPLSPRPPPRLPAVQRLVCQPARRVQKCEAVPRVQAAPRSVDGHQHIEPRALGELAAVEGEQPGCYAEQVAAQHCSRGSESESEQREQRIREQRVPLSRKRNTGQLTAPTAVATRQRQLEPQ